MCQNVRLPSWVVVVPSLLAFNQLVAQDSSYQAPDVSIFSEPEQVFELPGSGDYIGPEEIRRYNFNNINEILRNTTGVYSREEDGLGIFPNISIRGLILCDLLR